jgi:hypothetical protein
MLICNVSARPRHTIAAELVEIATANDAPTTGANVFASIVDDPAAVYDTVDAYFGEIMVEAASAADEFAATLDGNVLFDAPANAADSFDALFVVVVSIDEAATASTAQDASITAAPSFTTWNPADKLAVTLTNSDLTATTTATTLNGVRAVRGNNSGKYYFELTATTWTTTNDQVGLALSTATFSTNTGITGKAIITGGGAIWVNGSNTGVGLGTISSGTVVGIAVDLAANLIWFRIAPAGNWNGSGTANPATGTGGISISAIAGTLYPTFGGGTANSQVGTANFGATAFTGTVPSGFTSGW